MGSRFLCCFPLTDRNQLRAVLWNLLLVNGGLAPAALGASPGNVVPNPSRSLSVAPGSGPFPLIGIRGDWSSRSEVQ